MKTMPIDLRSDTVTRPTPAMREAMASAVVGDDVFGDDPTVQELEAAVAGLLGKEAALFVPSGTMANTIAMGVLAGGPGREVLLHDGAHILNYEGGAASTLWGLTLRTVSGDGGKFAPEQVREWASRPENVHFPRVSAAAIENTHNRAGGAVWSRSEVEAVAQECRRGSVGLHMDGARLWNAVQAGAGSLSELAAPADTVSVCFSKGLGAPVGSAFVSTRERVEEGRRLRKMLGGGMRQAGVLAAGALYALNHHRDRLGEDHRRAGVLAQALQSIRGIEVLPVQTNIVIVDMSGQAKSQAEVVESLRELDVWVVGFGGARFRMVTHLDVGDDDIDRAAKALRRVLGG